MMSTQNCKALVLSAYLSLTLGALEEQENTWYQSLIIVGWSIKLIQYVIAASVCVWVWECVCVRVCVCVCVCTRKHAVTLVVADSLQHYGLWPTRLLCPWDSPGKNTSVGCQGLLQGIFPTQGLNTHLLHLPALAGGFFTTSTIWEAPKQYLHTKYFLLVEFHEMIQVEMKQCCSLR